MLAALRPGAWPAMGRTLRALAYVNAPIMLVLTVVGVCVAVVSAAPPGHGPGLGLCGTPCPAGARAAYALVTLGVLGAWSYWMHRLTHELRLPVLWQLHGAHHDPVRGPKPLAVAGEMLYNVAVLSGPALLALPAWALHRGATLFYALVYTSIHLINYHDPALSDYHVQHHRDPATNFAPAVFDVAFGSHHAPSGAEDINHAIPNAALALVVVWLAARLLPAGALDIAPLPERLLRCLRAQ